MNTGTKLDTTEWEFPNSGHPWHGGDKDNVFVVPDLQNVIGVLPRLSFTFRAEIIGDVWSFLGEFSSNNNTSILVPVFIHTEPHLPAATVNMLVQPTFKATKRGLTEEVALAELRRIMELVPDGHVMVSSLAPAEEYTGVRKDHDSVVDMKVLEEYVK